MATADKDAGSTGGFADGPVLPLTAAQRGMWFAETLSEDYSVNIAQYLDIRYEPGELDHELLAQCNEEVGKAAESPYLRIVEHDGVPGQVIDVEYDQHVDIVDFRDEDDPMATAMSWMLEEYQRPIDIVSDQLVVCALLRIADDRTLWYTRGHHIIIDGYAALTMIRRTADRYNAVKAGRPAVEKPAATMAEIVADERKYVSSTRFQTDRAHWGERTRELPERLTLSHRSTQVPLSANNVVVSEALESDLQDRIERLAAGLGSSLAVVLTAAFGAFLGRMTATDDVVLSLPVTGRATAKIKRAGGMLSNILPIRLTGAVSKTGRDLIAHAQLELTGALRHQRYRSDDIRRDAGLDGASYSFGPTINMVFFDEPIEIVGADVEYRILASGILEDLLINLYQASPGAPLIVDLHGNPNLYSHAELQSHHRRFLEFVEHFVADIDEPILELPLLLPHEDRELEQLEQGPERTWTVGEAGDGGLLDLFAAQVRTRPDAVAVNTDDGEWTYREFDALRRNLAGVLVQSGVAAGDRVAVALERGVAQVVSVYAVLTVGATYVPIDPDQPPARRELILSSAQPSVVIDAEYLASAGFSAEERELSVIGRFDADSCTAAYVIFTSGSTGTPKGVQVSQRAVVNRLAWMQENYRIDPVDAVLYKTPITFDVSVWELFWPLQVGARMVIAREGGHRDPAYLRDMIVAHGVTTLHFVPSMLDVFVDSATAGSPVIPSSVRRVFTSGEALPAHLATRVVTSCDAELVNLYGPTEAAVDVTDYRVEGGEAAVPIGRPVANTAVYVLDARLRRVPVGVIGELYLSGIQLADCYVGRAALTGERFVANPVVPGERMYRTGDLVRWLASGALEYLGRTDFQIKIRGQRVELGEIETALLGEGSISAAVAVVRAESGPASVVAYVKARDGGAPNDELSERLLRWARKQLPGHMVPSAVVAMDVFPVNASGKLDRAALPAPAEAPDHQLEYVAPESAVECALVALLEELLPERRIGLRDNIFALGADSLIVARLASRLRAQQDATVSLSDIFDSRDVGAIAAAVERAGSVEELPPLRRGPRPSRIPTSHAQSRLWFINRMDPASGAYNMPGAVRLGAHVDIPALRAAVADVVDRHEPMRTRFPSVDGEPFQEVLSVEQVADQFALTVRDVSEPELAEVIAGEAAAGFDLVTQTPFRAGLLRVGGSEHVLVLVLHHIAGDGASMRPLIGDLVAAYSARVDGLAPMWEPLPVQYADYALWQRDVMGDPDDPQSRLAQEIAFWRHQLDGQPDLLALPTDRPRPRTPSGHGAYLDVPLPPGAVAGMRSLAGRFGVTMFTVLHVALAAVLARLGDTDDVSIGTAVAGRDESELTDLVGMFVNTVVLRSRVSQWKTVAELLGEAHRARTQALDHARVPFEQVVDAVAAHRSRSHSPLFQVALTLQRDSTSRLVGDDSMSLIDARVPSAKYDLSVTATESTGGDHERLDLDFAYATDLFDQSTIADIANYLVRILDGMSASPNAPIGAFDILSDEAAAAATVTSEAVTPITFRELLATGRKGLRGDAQALAGVESITNDVFEARTNQLARELIARGARPGSTVAISAHRSQYSVLAAVAVIKSGAAFVTIDPRHPADRRVAMLSDSGAHLGLATTAAAVRDLQSGIDWVVMDEVATELQLAGHSGNVIADEELGAIARIDDLAYLIYTSGSTGTPKAAAVTHRGLANLAANQINLLRVSAESRVLHVASPSFDASIFEITMALVSGASLVIADADTYAGAELEALIARHKVTHAVMTPSALGTLDPAAVPTLTTVLSAGEACPPELVRRWAGADRRFMNLYGPTEATIWASVDGPFTVTDDITIGTAVPGVGAIVLDSALRPTPPGVAGELYLTGAQLARGYLHRNRLTAERFVANPFADGVRMYRTGDRVTRRTDGRLVFHGRNDFQIKVRGLRIEPGEVDSALMLHPDVAAAVSLGVPGPTGEDILVAYVVGTEGSTVLPEVLINHVTDLLPGYMVPRTVIVLDEFALTNVGKIDRSKLPAVDFSTSRDFVGPRTQLEAVVAEVFAQVLGVERVSVDDGFFELGGNSLSATKVSARLSAALDRQIPVKEVFEAPTVAKLAEFVATSMAGHASPPLIARKRAEIVPVSSVQRGMWLVNRADPASPAYNVALALKLSGELDVDALRAGVGDLIRRHESLRTSYPMVNGEPVQVISPAEAVVSQLELQPVDVGGAVEDAVAAVTGRGFDVPSSAPVRMALLRESTNQHVVVFVVHHISADGASMAPLARDLMVAYAARSAGSEPVWPPLRVQYADFTLWQAERLAVVHENGVSERARQLDYWTQRLDGAPELLALATDRRRPTKPTFAGAVVEFELPDDLVIVLDSIARVHNTTLFMVTHAAFAVLLSKMSGQSDVVIGTPYAGRGDAALDEVVGMFVNSLALRTRIDLGERFSELLGRVRADDLTDMANSDVAFDEIVAKIGGGSTGAFNPIFQAMFSFQNLDFPGLQLDALTITPVSERLNAAKVDIQLSLFPNDPSALGATATNRAVKAQFMYATDLFEETTVQRYAQRYLNVLHAVAADPDVIVGNIALETVDADPGQATIAQVPLAELVAMATEIAPDREAVSGGGTTIAFSQLSALAGAMAVALPDADADAGLTMALMSSIPGLAGEGPESLDNALTTLRRNAAAIAANSDISMTTEGTIET